VRLALVRVEEEADVRPWELSEHADRPARCGDWSRREVSAHYRVPTCIWTHTTWDSFVACRGGRPIYDSAIH
jgi:hypothetical protein